MKSSSIVPFAILAAGVILAGAVYMSLKPSATGTATGTVSLMLPVGAADHILGNPTAKVKIVEYSDFDCPHCADFNLTLHKIVMDFGASGNVAWVFRNFPLTELHPNAKRHSEAAECVALTAGNDAYWKFSDSLFTHQPADPLKYAEYAKAAGANPDAVATCIQTASANGINARIDAERQNALEVGALGTPYTVLLVEGKAPLVIESAWPYDAVKDAVTEALKK